MIFAGIDAGSRSIKVALWDAQQRTMVAQGVADQGIDQNRLARELYHRLLAEQHLDATAVGGVVATGYGRGLIDFANATITEITCHAAGVHALVPQGRTIIEIGGQDSKIIRLDQTGRVRDFAMNDRCAAGTGRFLEIAATRLQVCLPDLDRLVSRSQSPATISNMCVVFAESEIIGLLSAGIPPSDIAAGVLTSVAMRISAMIGQKMSPPVVFTGGVALIPGMHKALEAALAEAILPCPTPLMTGALGAAILAAHKFASTLEYDGRT